MNAIDHSFIVFLNDALQCAPSKAGDLLKMARVLRPAAADDLLVTLERLENAHAGGTLQEECAKLREDMR